MYALRFSVCTGINQRLVVVRRNIFGYFCNWQQRAKFATAVRYILVIPLLKSDNLQHFVFLHETSPPPL